MMLHYTREMKLGEMFEAIFKLTGKSAGRSATIAATLFVPTGALLLFTISRLLDAIVTLVQSIPKDVAWDFEMLHPLVSPAAFVFFAVLLVGVAWILTELTIMHIMGNEMEGRRRGWLDALREMSSLPLARGVGLSLLLTAGGMLLLGAVVMLFSFGNEVAFLGGLLAFLGIIVLVVWATVLFLYSFAILACEDVGIFAALRRSASLVEERLWRTLGINLLFSFSFQMMVTIITTPVMLVIMGSFYWKLLVPPAILHDTVKSVEEVLPLLEQSILSYTFVIFLSVILQLFAQSAYIIVMYIDARAHKGEFAGETATVESGND